jgi:hypothetical protein
MERQKFAQKNKQALWRLLKRRKRHHPYTLPCILGVVAELARESTPFQSRQHGHVLSDGLVQRCSTNITNCIMQIYRMGYRKICQGGKFQGIVVGMLYMSRVGLLVGEVFTLHPIDCLEEFLPSETYLSMLGISNKVICDSENEIKSCIRSFNDAKK